MEPPKAVADRATAFLGWIRTIWCIFSLHRFMNKAILKDKEVSDKKSEESAANTARQANESSGPIWKTQHNRVQGAMWKHGQNGAARFTVSVSRSYRNESGKWLNVHYFDRQDLKDVRAVCDEAEQEMLRLEGMTVVPGED